MKKATAEAIANFEDEYFTGIIPPVLFISTRKKDRKMENRSFSLSRRKNIETTYTYIVTLDVKKFHKQITAPKGGYR